MKHTLYIWILIFAGMLGSCGNERVMDWNLEDSKLTISYATMDLVSRSENGVNSLNENKVMSVSCFLYLGNDGTTANADIVKTIAINVEDASSPTTFSIYFTKDELDKLSQVSSMTLYAVANAPNGLPANGNIAGIKKHQMVDTEFSTGNQPDSFVMDGQLIINVVKTSSGSLTYTFPDDSDALKLTRSASKIMLHVHASNVEDENDVEWIPQTSEMEVSFHNGVRYGYIDAGADIYLPENAVSNSEGRYYFSLDEVGFNSECIVNPGNSNIEYIQQTTPFYSYPLKWEDELDTTPYLMLVIPWQKKTDSSSDGNQTWVYYYYQIPINELQGKCMERNNFYKIFVDVKAFGSLVPTESVTLQPSYVVIDWGGPLDIPVGLKQYRYLVAEQNEYVMNNVNELTIPFITSHDCKLQNVEVLMDDLTHVSDLSGYNDISEEARKDPVARDQPQGTGTYSEDGTLYSNSGVTPCSNPTVDGLLTVNLDNTNFFISINHQLDNQTEITNQDPKQRKYDYQPIKIKFDIVHADNEQYKESFIVIQYPMMYVEAEWNNSFGENLITDNVVGAEYRGYVFVDGNQQTTSSKNWDMVRGCYDNYKKSNHNPCMYVVTITALDQGSLYILGDPRTGERLSDNDLYTGWDTKDATALASSNQRDLTYYNPTCEDNEMIIAPKFRIASSYSKLSGDFKQKKDMRKRCAAYQELGFPAGRWRLPTYAELNFVINLSVEGKIPHLFENNNGYWTATRSFVYRKDGGYIEEWLGQNSYPNDNYAQSYEKDKPVARGVVRPVYDEWYWTDKCPVNQFTWGDKP